jgi:hypothetical protein
MVDMTDTSPNQGTGKKCKDCSKSPDETVFGKHKRTTKNGIVYDERTICNFCESLRFKQYRQTNSAKIAEAKQKHHEKHHGTIKYHVQEKIATWRKASNVPSDLTVDYLIALYEEQDGYCYYSGEKMIFGWVDGKINHNSLSLDKIDPARGYIQGNVVWCTYLVNTMKQNLTDKQFYETIDKIYTTTYGISMINELSIADKLRKLTMQAKLGDLPKIIEQACAEKAKLGKSNCRLFFRESPGSKLPFYTAMGPANQEIWAKINHPAENNSGLTEDQFLMDCVKDLELETKLTITPLLYSSDTAKWFQSGPSAILDLAWDLTK